MDYSQYENYGFDRVSAFNLSTGYQERSYQAHWHSYGEFVLVGPGDTNIFMVNQNRHPGWKLVEIYADEEQPYPALFCAYRIPILLCG